MSFASPFEMLTLCFVASVCNSASILIGQSLGKNDIQTAYQIATNAIW